MGSKRVVAGPIGGFSIVEHNGRYHFNAPDGTSKSGLSLSDVYAIEELIKKLREGESKPGQGEIFPKPE